MTSCRAAQRGWAGATAVLLVSALLMPPAGPAVAQGAGHTPLEATPLILKDGRIASVSVHVLPFRTGDAQFAPGTLAGLSRVISEVATDCFLTAQVIGHVSPDEVGGNDTLAAHRLARSRADSVQASLMEGGLPAKSIASVWDWQFLVRDARATLWVFRLTEGEDCEGAPLAGAAPGLVAQTAPGAQAERVAPAPVARAAQPEVPTRSQTVARAEPLPPQEGPRDTSSGPITVPGRAAGSSAEQAAGPAVADATAHGQSAPVLRTAPIEPAAAGQDAPSRAATMPAGPAPAPAAPTVTQPIPAVSRAAPGPDAGTGAAAASQPDGSGEALAAVPPRQASPHESTGGPSLAVTFATNSSYFPPGATRELEALVKAVEAGKHYRAQLQAGVGSADRVVGASSAEEAALYHRWLAERRLARVQEWLESRFGPGELEIVPEFRANDDSRRVVVRLMPAG